MTRATDKVLVYTIEYRVDACESSNMDEVLNCMREVGQADIVDVTVEVKQKGKQ